MNTKKKKLTKETFAFIQLHNYIKIFFFVVNRATEMCIVIVLELYKTFSLGLAMQRVV